VNLVTEPELIKVHNQSNVVNVVDMEKLELNKDFLQLKGLVLLAPVLEKLLVILVDPVKVRDELIKIKSYQ